MSTDLLVELRKALRKAGDPARAEQQQAYMKSAMPYHGVGSSEMRAICKEVLSGYELEVERWQRDVLAIWREARFREERYAAIELAQRKGTKALHTHDVLPMLEEMITTGAWWDYVDALASHNLGWVLANDRARTKKTMLRWSKSDDMWKARASILCQLGFKSETDLELLYACIEPSVGSKEFFLRKAIGWALRQYAKTDPKEVRRYVAANESRLAPLSIREALKSIEETRREKQEAGKVRKERARQ